MFKAETKLRQYTCSDNSKDVTLAAFQDGIR